MVERHNRKNTTEGSARTLGGGEAPSRGEGRALPGKAGRKLLDRLFAHRSLYVGLCAGHIWAGIATHKFEVYLPLALMYLLLSVKRKP